METAKLLRQALGQDGHLVHVSFQSRFGAERWLEPYTEPTLRQWAREGITHVDVMCPGFLADCLETMEEIQMQCRSEEHTSELQSLMRISYAVFCLKKKKTSSTRSTPHARQPRTIKLRSVISTISNL